MTYLVIGIVTIIMVGVVGLVLLWALTEEIPRVTERVPFFQRVQDAPGEWAVRLDGVGRHSMKTMRLVNEVLGGDIAAAKWITEHPPALIVEGISHSMADDLVRELKETGAQATLILIQN